MIEVGVGSSTREETLEAAAEAAQMAVSTAGIIRSDFALIFATPHHADHYDRMIQEVARITGASQISGCSGVGVLTQRGEIEDGPGIAVMAVHTNTLSGYSFLFRDLGQRNLTIGHSIGEFAQSFRKGSELLVLFPDPYAMEAPVLFRGIQEEHDFGLPVIGACASEDAEKQITHQFSAKGVCSGSVSGIYLTGDFTHATAISQACHPVSGPLIVTRAQGNRIRELRGQAAMEHLSQLLNKPIPGDLSGALQELMVGVPIDPSGTELQSGKYVVCGITGIDPSDGSILTEREITEGQPISFVVRDRARSRQELEETLDTLSQSMSGNPPRFGLYFSDAGRGKAFHRAENVDVDLISKYLGQIPLAGFFSYGEIAPINGTNCLHSLAGILVLVSDPEP